VDGWVGWLGPKPHHYLWGEIGGMGIIGFIGIGGVEYMVESWSLLSSDLREFAHGSEFVIRILGRLLKTEEGSREGKVGTERLIGN